MAEMKISNILVNDTREKIIAYARQLFDQQINWREYHYTGDDGVEVYPFLNEQGQPLYEKFQSKLNEIFLKHYTDFQAFLHSKLEPGIIDSWKDIEEFLQNITDDETMTLMKLIGDIQEASGQLNIRMSDMIPGMMEAVTRTEVPEITQSNIDDRGSINIVYTYE